MALQLFDKIITDIDRAAVNRQALQCIGNSQATRQ
jgi:hypothetical protein